MNKKFNKQKMSILNIKNHCIIYCFNIPKEIKRDDFQTRIEKTFQTLSSRT